MVDLSILRLKPKAPLDGFVQPGRFGKTTGVPGVVICERTGFGLASVIARKGRSADVTAALSALVGATVADTCKRCSGGGVAVTGVAPGQWTVMAEASRANGFAADLQRRLQGIAAVAEQSDGRVVVEVSGPKAREMLAKGVPLDLDASVFRLGDAAQTLVSHLNVQIVLIDAAPVFELSGMSTFAGSLWSWLSASAAEFGGEFRRQ